MNMVLIGPLSSTINVHNVLAFICISAFWFSPATVVRVEIVYVDRLDVVSGHEAEDATVEIKLGVKGALDVFGAAESVLLSLENYKSDRDSFFAEGVGHALSLIGRNDFILVSLKEDNGTG